MMSGMVVLALIVLIWVFFGLDAVNLCGRGKIFPSHLLSRVNPNDKFGPGLFAIQTIG